MFYALSDYFTGEYPKEYTHGFANTKYVICFRSIKARKKWLMETKLLSARSLTRKEALKELKWITNSGKEYDKVKVCEVVCDRINGEPNDMFMHIVEGKNF